MTTKALTVRERRFIGAFMGSAHGNATLAALTAGYTRNRASAAQIASRLLRKVNIRAVIDARASRAAAQEILTADQRDARLSVIALRNDDAVAVAAIRELNKCSGRHSIKHVLDVTEKLSDIIAGSRQK